MSTNTILLGVLFLLLALAIFFIIRVELRLKRLFRGSKARDLEGLLADITKELDSLGTRTLDNEDGLKKLVTKLQSQGRGVKLLRFNPFPEVGGNHSFAVGIVNS